MAEMNHYKLEEFHGKIFRQMYPVSGNVFSFGNGKTTEDKVLDSVRRFFAVIGPGGIGQYSLNYSGRMYVIALGHPVDASYKPKGKDVKVDTAGYDFWTFVSLGCFPRDLVGFVEKNFRNPKDRLALMAAEGGKFGGVFQEKGVLIGTPDVKLTDRVRRDKDRLIYTPESGVDLDYSECLVG